MKSESLVVQRLRERGAKIIAHRLRTPYAELDIVAWKGGEYHILEVKTACPGFTGLDLIGLRQKRRLLRARLWWEEHHGPTKLWIAMVERSGQITVVPLTN